MPLKGSVSTASFDEDISNRHIIYYYDVPGTDTPSGRPEQWKYETWFFNEDRVVYAIHGGPMKGRKNYQAATYQCIRPGELWQCSWLEETGTEVCITLDIPSRRVTAFIGFSMGHWTKPAEAHGDKRNPQDLERWRELAKVGGSQVDRIMLSEQGHIVEDFRGAGDLETIDMSWPTL